MLDVTFSLFRANKPSNVILVDFYVFLCYLRGVVPFAVFYLMWILVRTESEFHSRDFITLVLVVL